MYMAVPSSASSIFDTKSLSCLQGGKYSARGTAEKHRTITIGNISLISDLVLSYLYLYLYLLLAFTFHIYLEARGIGDWQPGIYLPTALFSLALPASTDC